MPTIQEIENMMISDNTTLLAYSETVKLWNQTDEIIIYEIILVSLSQTMIKQLKKEKLNVFSVQPKNDKTITVRIYRRLK